VTGTDLLSSTANHIIYIVKRGDTLPDIARAFGTTVQAIMQLNNIESARDLDIGTRLKIQKR
jgi:LysM repeat protein